MRLIDLDKALAEAEDECRMSDDWKVAHEMMNVFKYQPTVEAIPIEFIKQLIEKFDCERGNAIKDTFAHILTGLLEFWEFEQEKENPVKISEGNYDSDEEYEEQMRCLDEN